MRCAAVHGVAIVAAAALAGCATPGQEQWRLALDSNDSHDWTEDWFLEGDQASVRPVARGFVFTAGNSPGDPASHAVLWTRKSYSGDIRVEYTYMRLDTMTEATGVNILYLLATGIGEGASPVDILQSSPARGIPWMSHYFLNMNLLHISYAASGPERSHYVSARRYPARSRETFDRDTLIQPVYDNVQLFEPGTTYKITATKQGDTLGMAIDGGDILVNFSWDLSAFAAISDGRVGLRHMGGRSSRYQDFKIYVKE